MQVVGRDKYLPEVAKFVTPGWYNIPIPMEPSEFENQEAYRFREQALEMRRQKLFDEALDIIKQAWVLEKGKAGRARLLMDAAWVRIGLDHLDKAREHANKIVELKISSRLGSEAGRALRFIGLKKRSESSVGGERREEISRLEKESIEADQYVRNAQRPGFASAQRRWLADNGISE